MTVNKFFLFFLLTSGITYAQSRYSFETKKVTNDIYVLYPKINPYRWVTSNVIVIENSNDVVVVDSGLLPSAAEAAIAEIKKITSKPVKYLLNTHWHGDHWQGNEAYVKAYPGIEIVASAEGRDGIATNGRAWVDIYYKKYFAAAISNYENLLKNKSYSDGKKISDEELTKIKEGLEDFKKDLEEMKTVNSTLPTITYSDKFFVYRGDREIQIHYLGFGNTTGDAIVYLPKEKVLITGDMVVYPSPYESGAFSKEWMLALEKLKSFPFNFMIPGHGEVQTDASYIDFLDALFKEIIKQVNQAWLNGTTQVEEAQKIVTHESVITVVGKDNRFKEFIKNLDTSFVASAVKTALQKAKEKKL